MSKRISPNQKVPYKTRLNAEYSRWKYIYENGCSDPFYCDGVNLQLVRNHIIHYKRECEEELQPWEYPDEYFYPLPIEVPYEFMAKDRSILGKLHNNTKTFDYSEALNFDWSECFD